MRLRNGKTLKRLNADLEQQKPAKKNKITSSSTASVLQTPSFIDHFSQITRLPNHLVQLFFQYDGRYHNAAFFNQVYSSLEERILNFIYYAGPFAQLKIYIEEYAKKTDPAQLERFFIDTVFTIEGVQCRLMQLPFVVLDYTVGDEEGMAEWLTRWLTSEFPHRYEDIFTLASDVCSSNIAEEAQRKMANRASIDRVFEAFKQKDNRVVEKELKNFDDFIKSIKLNLSNKNGKLTDARFNDDLLHLILCAFEVIDLRGEELPDGRMGAKTTEFCCKVIGTLQSKLSPRLKQLFHLGIWFVLFNGFVTKRQIDIGGLRFAQDKLGLNCYYNIYGKQKVAVLLKDSRLQFPELIEKLESSRETWLLQSKKSYEVSPIAANFRP